MRKDLRVQSLTRLHLRVRRLSQMFQVVLTHVARILAQLLRARGVTLTDPFDQRLHTLVTLLGWAIRLLRLCRGELFHGPEEALTQFRSVQLSSRRYNSW